MPLGGAAKGKENSEVPLGKKRGCLRNRTARGKKRQMAPGVAAVGKENREVPTGVAAEGEKAGNAVG